MNTQTLHTRAQAHMLMHTASFAFAPPFLVGWQLPLGLFSNAPSSAAALQSAGLLCHCMPNPKKPGHGFHSSLLSLYHLCCSTSAIKWGPTGQNQGTSWMVCYHPCFTGHLALSFHHLVQPWSLGPGGCSGEGSGLHSLGTCCPSNWLGMVRCFPSSVPTKGSQEEEEFSHT